MEIDAFLLGLFQRQVWTQCQFALRAYEAIGQELVPIHEEVVRSVGPSVGPADPLDARRRVDRGEDEIGPVENRLIGAWSAIQTFLSAAANISKALWGEGGRLSEARQPLRASLNVTEDSPLAGPPFMRNNFDHFDERLDRWWRESKSHGYIDMNMGAGSFGEGTFVFRHYDPSTGDVTFWGQSYNLPIIVAEIRRIALIARSQRFGRRSAYGSPEPRDSGT